MRKRITLLAAGYLAITGILLASAYQTPGTVTISKTDRIAGAGTPFLIERFAG